MLVYLLDAGNQYLNEIDLLKEDVLGITVYDEIAINHKNYRIIKKKFYYEEDNSGTYMDYADFMVTVL
jgi:hypothetical protein